MLNYIIKMEHFVQYDYIGARFRRIMGPCGLIGKDYVTLREAGFVLPMVLLGSVTLYRCHYCVPVSLLILITLVDSTILARTIPQHRRVTLQ